MALRQKVTAEFLVRLLVGLIALAALTGGTVNGADVKYRATLYHVFVTQPRDVSLYWRDPQGERFGQLSVLQRYLTGQGRRVRFLMNAGIFEADGTPSGLLVIDGKVLRSLNQRWGRGNFYLQPNGVFFIDGEQGFVRSSDEYAARQTPPRLAIQSGPLLLRDGRTHPAFRADSTSRLHRNGVGVRRDGTVIFAITEFGQDHRPNLWEFADFFRSQGCDDALFLDGDISQMEIDPSKPLTPGNYFGAIFAVSEPGR